MKKMVITRNIDQHYHEQIKTIIPDWELVISKDKNIWQEHILDAEIIAGWQDGLEEYCLDPHSTLKWLQSWSAGVDYLPLEELNARSIYLTSANGVHANPISETIFALMLGLTRKLHTYVKN